MIVPYSAGGPADPQRWADAQKRYMALEARKLCQPATNLSWPDRVRAVTTEQVRAAAQKWLDKKRSVTGYLVKDLMPKHAEKRS